MIRCLIIEDEPLAQQLLAGYITQTSELELVRICNNCFSAFEVLHQEQIDLILQDIQMPMLNGMNFIKSLKDPPAVIFITAFPEYAAESYEILALDYMVKPVTYERFIAGIHKFLNLKPALKAIPSYTFFKVNGKFVKLHHDEILYAQSIKDYIVLHTASGKYMTHMTMKYLTSIMPSAHFKRVHRSYLINIEKLSSIGKDELMIGSQKIPVGKNYKRLI